MDVVDENMTSKEMLEKIAELDYSQSQLKDLNDEMRHWLDMADDEMAVLRSENTSLRKQVNVLEKIVSEAQQVESEPCSSLLAYDTDAKRCSEKKIQELEEESTMIKEQNKKLTTELKSLQLERDRDKITLSQIRIALQTLECGIEEAQSGLQHRDEVIHQKSLELKHSEETIEECSNIIKDLRLMNQELRNQLEDKQDEASFAILNDLMGEQEGSVSPPLSFAEEIKLLATSAEVKTSMSDSTDLRHEETETEELQKLQSHLKVHPQTKRCAGVLTIATWRAGLLILFVIIVAIFTFMASGRFAGHSNLFSIHNLWHCARLMLQPYCTVQYGALPPI